MLGADAISILIVSPCRNEAGSLMATATSVIRQTHAPSRWVIVDDGSTDGTSQMLAELAGSHSWISVVQRADRGGRSVGPGVVEAFYSGLAAAPDDDWTYVCKLDMDLELPPNYFADLVARMEQDPRLGITSGQAYYIHPNTQELVSEGIGQETAVGASKFYRRRCFEQIGGLVRQVMWDGIDGHRARMLGWTVHSKDEPNLRFIHLRPMGSSQKGIWTGRQRHGFGQYFMGTGLLYMTASALFRMAKRPRIIGGLAMWWGYVKSALTRKPRLEDPEFRKFLRRYQWRMLTRGKQRATKEIEREFETAWDPDKRTRWESELSKSLDERRDAST